MTVARIDRLSIRSREGVLVDDISLELTPGRALTLLGESGSGKSVLAQAILGTLPTSLVATGVVTINGRTSAAADQPARRPLWGSSITLLPQEPWLALDPTMRVGVQVAETYALVSKVPAADARARASATLSSAGLPGTQRAWPHTLSGGMAQRAAFAIARAGGAPILLVDEPTKGLDATRREALVSQLVDLLGRGGSVLTITHDVGVARALGGDAAIMLNGRIVEHGRSEDVLVAPRNEYSRRLLAAAPEAWPPRRAPAVGQRHLVSLRGVSKSFGGRTLFDHVNLDIYDGERIVLAGPSGSGKTTFGNIIVGTLRPDAGVVERGPDVGRLEFQKLYQDPVAAFAPLATLGRSFRDLLALHQIDRGRLDELLQTLRLDPSLLNRRPAEISGGELQRLALARVLLMRPSLIVADEPTSRLDPITQQISMDLLIDAIEEAGATLVLITHDTDIARSIGGRTLEFGRA
jgi:peptide/nickel transport system ATP-binding protein